MRGDVRRERRDASGAQVVDDQERVFFDELDLNIVGVQVGGDRLFPSRFRSDSFEKNGRARFRVETVEAADARRRLPRQIGQNRVVERRRTEQHRRPIVASVVRIAHFHRQNFSQRRIMVLAEPPEIALPTAEHQQTGAVFANAFDDMFHIARPEAGTRVVADDVKGIRPILEVGARRRSGVDAVERDSAIRQDAAKIRRRSRRVVVAQVTNAFFKLHKLPAFSILTFSSQPRPLVEAAYAVSTLAKVRRSERKRRAPSLKSPRFDYFDIFSASAKRSLQRCGTKMSNSASRINSSQPFSRCI